MDVVGTTQMRAGPTPATTRPLLRRVLWAALGSAALLCCEPVGLGPVPAAAQFGNVGAALLGGMLRGPSYRGGYRHRGGRGASRHASRGGSRSGRSGRRHKE